jgi:hypothetical protein
LLIPQGFELLTLPVGPAGWVGLGDEIETCEVKVEVDVSFRLDGVLGVKDMVGRDIDHIHLYFCVWRLLLDRIETF